MMPCLVLIFDKERGNVWFGVPLSITMFLLVPLMALVSAWRDRTIDQNQAKIGETEATTPNTSEEANE
jgi:hypothetical protein